MTRKRSYSRKSSEGEKLQLATDEKLTIVKLNRTLKNKNDEIAELKYTIEKLRQVGSGCLFALLF